MPFFSRAFHLPHAQTRSAERSSSGPDALPALVRERDLALLVVLVTILLPDTSGMQFAETSVFFYWFLGFVTFLLPSLWVFGWLLHQAPRHVPFYVWIVRLVPEQWRSALLFLMWWPGILVVLATLGTCVSLLQRAFPSWLSAFPAQYLAFAVLLLLATLLTLVPLRLFRIVLWSGGLLYLVVFLFLVLATILALLSHRNEPPVFPYPALIILPAHFSWSLFGLTLLCLFGPNGPLLLDGELRGEQRFLRRSARALWWGSAGSFLFLLGVTIAWTVLNPRLHVMQTPLLQLVVPILGPGAGTLAWLWLFLGIFGCALAYMLLFSRTFLLAARMGYLPRSLGRLNHAGVPERAMLTQSALIVCTAVMVFVVTPALLQGALPAMVVNELRTGDQFGLFTSIASSLWCGLTALLFVFALWLFWKKRHRARRNWVQRVTLPVLCLSGGLTSLICTVAPLLPDWPALFFSRTHWFPLVLCGVTGSLAVAWLIGELPRRSALVREKEKRLVQEKEFSKVLQRAYQREHELRAQVREAYEELNQLYREQEQAARTDAVTGLLNHRAFVHGLDEAITRGQREARSFLVVFLDLDHFKAINDTWGHLAGDAVLHEVASRLREALHPGDVAARYGGEEFALILGGATMAQAWDEAEHLRQRIQSVACTGLGTARIGVTVSIGVAAYGIHGTQRNQLIEKADQAMYQAKLAGRNCVRVAGM